MLNAFIRAKRPAGSECAIDLMDLETALTVNMGGEYLFLPESGKIVFRSKEVPFGFGGLDDEDEEDAIPEDVEVLRLDPISSHKRFQWMEAFMESVHSIAAQSAIRGALRQKKPFRHFKDALMEYPAVRQQWFQFEAARVKREAIRIDRKFRLGNPRSHRQQACPGHFNRD